MCELMNESRNEWLNILINERMSKRFSQGLNEWVEETTINNNYYWGKGKLNDWTNILT